MGLEASASGKKRTVETVSVSAFQNGKNSFQEAPDPSFALDEKAAARSARVRFAVIKIS